MQQATPQEANILQRILQSPFAQKLVDEDNLAKKTAREKLIAELAELKRGAIDRAPGVRARHDVALKALEAAL